MLSTRASLALAAFVSLGLAACATPRPAPGAHLHAVNPVTTHNTKSHTTQGPLGPEASPITFERMARFPEPGWQVPRGIAFAPDGSLVTYLQSESESEEMSLYALDTRAGTSAVILRASDLLKDDRPMSREEELRRERQRQRASGITQYGWAKSANVMVIPMGGDVFVRRADGSTKRLTDSPEPEMDPKLCADGTKVAFVRGSELYVIDVETGKERALTRGAPEGVTRGQSDFNGQEEFDEPSGHFWSPDCAHLAYLEVDERPVAEVPVLGFRAGEPDLMMQRYPEAGRANPSVRLFITDVRTGKSTPITIPAVAGQPAPYLGRFTFSQDGATLYFQSLARDQQHKSLLRVDVKTGEVSALWSESSPAWVEMADMAPLKDGKILWVSGQSGHLHLELRDGKTGARLSDLTPGAWEVFDIAGVDEESGAVFVIGNKDGDLDRQLYRLADGVITRVTTEPGVHAVTMDAKRGRFMDVHSAADRLPVAALRGPKGEVLSALPQRIDADLASLGIRTPEMVTLKSPTGEALHGALLTPRDMDPSRKYPAIVMVYGGPGVQTVQNQWTPRLMWQHLADRGYVVFQLDNRGSAGRGPAFAAHIRERLGEVELEDQLLGADYLESLPYVDKGRLGIYGHSYGGFMAALAMLKAPGRFKVGIAGSPVTDWSLYDTGYTERFMATPQTNEAGYAASDLSRLAPKLEGKLLIVHALMDENVHFQNTAQLVDALVAADKDFEMFVFPGERHGYRSPAARRHALRRVTDYLMQNL